MIQAIAVDGIFTRQSGRRAWLCLDGGGGFCEMKKAAGRCVPLPCSVLGGDFVRKVEQFDRPIHVGLLPEIKADPATIGKDVVGFGAASRNQLIADFFRKGNVNQAVAMYVADFSPAQAVFCTSKAMRLGCDPRPTL